MTKHELALIISLVLGGLLVVTGVALWTVPAALILAGILTPVVTYVLVDRDLADEDKTAESDGVTL